LEDEKKEPKRDAFGPNFQLNQEIPYFDNEGFTIAHIFEDLSELKKEVKRRKNLQE
jgi:hypothetical protein